MDLNYEDPPPEAPLQTRWKDVAKELADNPHRWAKFEGIDTSLAYRIKRGDYSAFPNPPYEATIRREGPEGRTVVLYIRYVGLSGEADK